MSNDVIFPRLDQGMTDGLLSAWLVDRGDPVAAGDAIATIESDKVSVDVESPVDGIVLDILVPAESRASVGSVIARIGSTEELAGGAEPTETSPEPGTTQIRDVPATEPGARIDSGVPLTASLEVPQSGTRTFPKLPVDRSTWERPHTQSPRQRLAVDLPSSASVQGKLLGYTSIQRATRETVLRSQEIPQFQVGLDVRMDAARDLVAKLRGRHPASAISVTDVLMKAVAAAARAEPRMNAWCVNDGVRVFDDVDLNLLYATAEGLLNPCLERISNHGLLSLAETRHRLREAASSGSLTPGELRVGSITVSSLATTAVDEFSALVFPPQVAVVAAARARVEVPGSPCRITVSVDHRAVGGFEAATFLSALRDHLESPSLLLA